MIEALKKQIKRQLDYCKDENLLDLILKLLTTKS